MGAADFWNNQELAQSVVQQVKALKNWVDPFEALVARVQSAKELAELLDAEPDEEMDADLAAEIERIGSGARRVPPSLAALASRRLPRRAAGDRGRRRWHRGAGLGADGHADVHPLGRAERATRSRSST